jgi:deoxyribose-phosphate aldolase
MEKINLASLIDHTLLRADASEDDIRKHCMEAKASSFAAVCVNLHYISFCALILKGTNVKVCAPIGFPLGAVPTENKVAEVLRAVKDGADELDMVMNLGAFKSRDFDFVVNDIKAVKNACGDRILKVIIETAYLSDEEKVKACSLLKQAKADFVKTSTGFGPSGAKVKDVIILRDTVGIGTGVKASGGIKTFEDAVSMIDAGADRIGTSSSMNILKGSRGSN